MQHQILTNQFATADYDGAPIVDRRRRKLRPPHGSRLVPDGDTVQSQPLRNPPVTEDGQVWERAVIVALRPPYTPTDEWWAEFETPEGAGAFRLEQRERDLLGRPPEAVALLEREVLVRHDGGGRYLVDAVPAEDEQTPNGMPLVENRLQPVFTAKLLPTDQCPCLSGRDYQRCHGAPRPTFAMR